MPVCSSKSVIQHMYWVLSVNKDLHYNGLEKKIGETEAQTQMTCEMLDA